MFRSTNRAVRACALAASAVLVPLMGAAAHADTVATISNGNSSTSFDLSSPALQDSWTVDGVNEFTPCGCADQTFYYSVGDSAPAPISSLDLTSYNAAGNVLTADYTGNGFTLQLTAILTGGASHSGDASISEQVSIDNTANSGMLDMHLYEYGKFYLNGQSGNETESITGPLHNTVNINDPQHTMAQIVATPVPNYWEVATGMTLKDMLNSGSPVTLNDDAGPVTGDAAYALEFNECIDSGSAFNLSITKSIGCGQSVPLPKASSMVLSTLAGIGVLAALRRKAVVA